MVIVTSGNHSSRSELGCECHCRWSIWGSGFGSDGGVVTGVVVGTCYNSSFLFELGGGFLLC
ncbi:hypothetical protein TorRG33x02_078970 [Trema orientale]|uniref:Uncharacterized protein n=1 Tax=Trema orientale TaxID=63057 RepID=A0A2P5FET9_TREOI|nr:hypothetical protein TorRG33x02_078970 [Trema orientale]